MATKKGKINDYKFICDNSVGVAIVIRKNIPYNRTHCATTHLNSVFIEIEVLMNNICNKYLSGSLYVPA